MIFQHTWQQVLDGSKTQTRRIVKPGQVDNIELAHDANEWPDISIPIPKTIQAVFTGGERGYFRLSWQVNKTYAVQPGRGKKGVGRIHITDIRREKLQDITEDDAIAEGCKPELVVTRMAGEWLDEPSHWLSAREDYAERWGLLHTKPGTRWEDNPEVWVLTFEVCDDLS